MVRNIKFLHGVRV